MSFNRKIHIVSHTHWDREWYFSTCDSLVLLDQTISDILKELNDNPKANFCLDGQVSILEDYLKLYPHKLENIQALVKEDRLFIGPWFTQTDTQLVSEQSIVGNLYYGIYRSLQLVKDYMRVGYLPDTFGFSNQMPMLMRQFGIDNFVFWRGTDFKKQNIEPYFTWIAQDNSEVTGIVLHQGYGMAKGLNSSNLFVEKKLKPLIEEYKQLTKTKDILIPVGNDQNNVVVALDQKIAKISEDLHISSYEEFAKTIASQVTTSYKGEFREVLYSRIHKTSGAIRMDIKQSNYRAEMELIKVLEPLNVMANMEQKGISNELIQEAWKLLFEGQAHDGIIGCVSDSVALDILTRNRQAYEIAQSAQNLLKKQFAQMIELQVDELLIFNLDVQPFHGYKEVEVFTHTKFLQIEGVHSQSIVETIKYDGYPMALVEKPEGNYYEKEQDYYLHKVLVEVDLPSFGYRTFKYHEIVQGEKDALEATYMENELYKIVYDDHKVTLTTDGKTISDFIALYDCGNAGDTYDFSPVKNDVEFRVEMHTAKVRKKSNVQVMKIDCSVLLPYSIEDRMKKGATALCPATIEISLRKGEGIYVKVFFENTVLSHRLRLAIKGIKGSDKVCAATPFGSVERSVGNDSISDNWRESYVEYPIDIETNSGFVQFMGEGKQLTVFNKGIKEYQAIEDSIYMTLFSACDELGKPDLQCRPGRASGDTTKKGHIRMMTPLAQVQGVHTFEFMIAFVPNDDKQQYQMLHEFESPSIFYQNQSINLFYERIDNKIQLQASEVHLPKEQSYMHLHSELLVSSIYTSLFDNQFKLRVMAFEETDKEMITFTKPFHISNLLEEGNEQVMKAYRLYTLKGVQDEN